MFPERIYNINIESVTIMPSPIEAKTRHPMTAESEETVYTVRKTLEEILDRRDPRLFVVVGPCSIHDPEAALEYAERLRRLADDVSDTLFLVMRVYFEKPRTTLGWKGFINDPNLDGSYRIEEGILRGRELLLQIAGMGLGAATEALDPIIPQYHHDLISWTSIGARTTESQRHREMASGLSTPIGLKNTTEGNIQVAVNALRSIAEPHHFIGIDPEGHCAIMETRGNRYGHLVLRGGNRTNYDPASIALCEKSLHEARLPERIVVDCSHGNSKKNPSLQPAVMESCVDQILAGNISIVGLMLESHLNAGSQPLPDRGENLLYGVSVTDACMDWETTETTIRSAGERLRGALPKRLEPIPFTAERS